MFVNSYPLMESVSGSMYWTIKKEAIPVKIIEDQFPMFRAFCTSPFSSLIVTNAIPIIENTIPKPAKIIGNNIGAIPPNASSEIISLPKTMVARIVAT